MRKDTAESHLGQLPAKSVVQPSEVVPSSPRNRNARSLSFGVDGCLITSLTTVVTDELGTRMFYTVSITTLSKDDFVFQDTMRVKN